MLSSLLKSLLIRLVSEKIVLELMVQLGDWAVPRTTNQLDDAIWSPVRKALGAENEQK